jgi:MFS family permease
MDRTLLQLNNNNTNTTINDGNEDNDKTRTIGLIFAISTLSYLLFTPLAGVLGDKCSGSNSSNGGGRSRNKRYMVVMIGVLLLAGGLCSFWVMGHGWFGLIIGLIGIGIGMAFIDAPVAALLADIMDVRGHR